MDRRTFLRTAAASTGSVAVAGCLGEDDQPVSDLGGGPPQYDLPAYAGWPPAESYAGEGVVFMHVELSTLPTLRRAVDNGTIASGRPLQALPAYSIEQVPNAIETLRSYPFAADLRRAVNEAVDARSDGSTATETLVEPIDDVADRNVTTNESTTNAGNVTTNESTTNAGNVTTNETTPGGGNATTNESTTNAGNATGVEDQPTIGDWATEGTDEAATSDVLGVDVTGVALIDDLLCFHGQYDLAVISDRYTHGFQQVDEQRGIEIYEHVDSELAFAVSDELLIVPTERDQPTVAAETVLAHSLSRYINTIDRVVDSENGRWLFETTGQPALSLGVWGADDPIGRLTTIVGEPPVDDSDLVFGSIEDMITTVEATVDDSGALTALGGRFAGLFSEPVPTENELQSALIGEASSEDLFVDGPRVTLSATFVDR